MQALLDCVILRYRNMRETTDIAKAIRISV